VTVTAQEAAPVAVEEDEGPPVDVKERLAGLAAAARGGRTSRRRTTAKKTAPRKAAPKKATTPAGVRRQRYGDRIVGWGKLGVGLVAKDPVSHSLLMHQVHELGPIVDSLAEEDPRVAAALDKLFGVFGKGGAWAKLGGWAVATGGSLALVRGFQHPLLAMMCGPLVDSALVDAAVRLATEEANARGEEHPHPVRIIELRDELRRQMLAPVVPTTTPAPYGVDPFGQPFTEQGRQEYEADAAGPVGVPV
jgi:hypothetical protein